MLCSDDSKLTCFGNRPVAVILRALCRRDFQRAPQTRAGIFRRRRGPDLVLDMAQDKFVAMAVQPITSDLRTAERARFEHVILLSRMVLALTI